MYTIVLLGCGHSNIINLFLYWLLFTKKGYSNLCRCFSFFWRISSLHADWKYSCHPFWYYSWNFDFGSKYIKLAGMEKWKNNPTSSEKPNWLVGIDSSVVLLCHSVVHLTDLITGIVLVVTFVYSDIFYWSMSELKHVLTFILTIARGWLHTIVMI